MSGSLLDEEEEYSQLAALVRVLGSAEDNPSLRLDLVLRNKHSGEESRIESNLLLSSLVGELRLAFRCLLFVAMSKRMANKDVDFV